MILFSWCSGITKKILTILFALQRNIWKHILDFHKKFIGSKFIKNWLDKSQ